MEAGMMKNREKRNEEEKDFAGMAEYWIFQSSRLFFDLSEYTGRPRLPTLRPAPGPHRSISSSLFKVPLLPSLSLIVFYILLLFLLALPAAPSRPFLRSLTRDANAAASFLLTIFYFARWGDHLRRHINIEGTEQKRHWGKMNTYETKNRKNVLLPFPQLSSHSKFVVIDQ